MSRRNQIGMVVSAVVFSLASPSQIVFAATAPLRPADVASLDAGTSGTATDTSPTSGEVTEAGSSSAVSVYLHNRGRDAMDICEICGGCSSLIPYLRDATGKAAPAELLIWFLFDLMPEVDIEATVLAHIGVGANGRTVYGIRNGVIGSWREGVGGFPLTNLGGWLEGGYWGKDGNSVRYGWPGGLIFHVCDSKNLSSKRRHSHACALVPLFFTFTEEEAFRPRLNVSGQSLVRLADIRAGAVLPTIGFTIGVSPGELLDFLGGWFGLDLAGDDETE